jgi:hypothetical protein
MAKKKKRNADTCFCHGRPPQHQLKDDSMPKRTTALLKFIILFFFSLPTQTSQARTVDLVVIHEEGKSMEAEPELVEMCRAFKPTIAQLTHYFNYAYPIEADWATQERYTPCYASGIVTFNDNTYGEWTLYSGGTASFTFRRGDHITFFYRYNAWIDPTKDAYAPLEKPHD